MPNSSKDKKNFLKYKWEFLRRNRDYISERKELCNILNSVEYWGMMSDSDPKPKLVGFYKKWNINYPLDPSISYDDYLLMRNNKISMYVRKNLHRFLSQKPHVRVLNSIDFLSYKDLNKIAIAHRLDKELFHNGKLIVEIDLNYSKSQLKRSLESLIEYKQKHRRSLRVNAGKSEKPKSKLHYDNYDYYLAVFDLKREGKSWSKIRKAMDFNSDHTARDYYDAAKRLVRKGLSM